MQRRVRAYDGPMDTLTRALSEWSSCRAVVIGDFMLDRQTIGTAERLSPDAPVPVLKVEEHRDQPGGAASVCLDLAAMRAEVVAIGLRGDDEPGRALGEHLSDAGVDARGLVVDHGRPTTLKQSLIGLAQGRHAQKMFRVDTERADPIQGAALDSLLEAFGRALEHADVVVLEDYSKGVCTPRVCRAVIDRAADARVPVFVDPAPIGDYGRYRGADVITPNRTEAAIALGADAPETPAQTARTLRERHAFGTVVLTLDKQGALLDRADLDAPILIGTDAVEVYDVTGAGDMMVAALAAGRANAMGWEDAIRFANAAAGLEVRVMGVAPIPIERIHHEILRRGAKERGVTRSLDEAVVMARAAREEGQRVVFTNGCFDVLHAGHVSLLERAASLGDLLIVGLNDDHSVRALKGPTRPVHDQDQRARVLGALGCVDAVVLFHDETPIDLIERIGPDVLVKGGDYTPETVVGADAVTARGGRVEILDLVEGLSSSATIERLKRP